MDLISGATFLVAIQLGLVAMLNLANSSVANRLLGALMLVFFWSVKYFLLDYLQVEWLVHFLEGISLSKFYGPVIYLFLLAVSKNYVRTSLLQHLSFPIVLGIFYKANDYWKLLPEQAFLSTSILLEYGLLLAYFILSLRLFRQQRFAQVKIRRRYWLFFWIVFIDLIYNFGELALSIFLPDVHESMMPMLFTVDMLIYLLIFLYLTLFGITELNWIRKLFVPKSIHYNVQTEEEDQIATTLDQLFQEEKLHLDSNLTLKDVASAIKISRTHLSEYLTSKKGISFNDLVNRYRVEEFKQLITDSAYSHLDITGVAYASGFGSKATFYRVFKQAEGMTPSAYRKQISKTP